MTRTPGKVPKGDPPPADAVSLCDGTVMHARLRPVGHRFSYRVASILVDIDRLDEADRKSVLFSVGRFNLFGFDPADHGPADGTPLRPWVERELARAGLAEPPHRILLHCAPRVLGFVFDPLSVWFCFDAGDRLVALVYAVRNTFGDRHAYVAPIRAGEDGPAGIRQERDKLFHVSPFIPVEARYRFRIQPPGRELRIRILEVDGAGPLLSATHAARVAPLTSRALAQSFCRMPLVTLKIVGAIHFEAARLWLKGVPFYARPTPPAAVSHGEIRDDHRRAA